MRCTFACRNAWLSGCVWRFVFPPGFGSAQNSVTNATYAFSNGWQDGSKRVPNLCRYSSLRMAGKPYQQAFAKTFYVTKPTGKRGQPRRELCPQFALAQTVKWRERGRVLGIRVCHLLGAVKQIVPLLPQEQVLNTAYIERINATFRQRLAGLHRRTRCLCTHPTSLVHSVWLVGTVSNFCRAHRSLTTPERQVRTPAMAAGLSGHIWSVAELLCFAVAPLPYIAPKRRGRNPKVQEKGFTV